MPILQKLFDELANIAGLFLNLPKCVLIPLWLSNIDTLREALCEYFPWWSRMDIKFSGTYLGFALGPEAKDTGWDKPIKQFLASAEFL